MHWFAACTAVVGLYLSLSFSADAQPPTCERSSGSAMRDVHWRHKKPAHPLVGQVIKADQPISIVQHRCTRSPLQQLIVEVWDTIRQGGIVMLGEVHDNPEHHAVRGDILWPRLDQTVTASDLHPGAVFEHIRTSQQAQLDSFYSNAARSRRLWRAPDLLRVLGWNSSGWPEARIFYPLFDAALWAKEPIYPGNVVRERMLSLVRGEAAHSSGEAARLELARALPQPLIDALTTELEASHCGVLPASALAPIGLAQRYTDAHLAEAVLDAARRQGAAFLLAGNGHVRTDRGVPWYVRRLAPGIPGIAMMFLEVEEGKVDAAAYLPRAPNGAPAADYVVFTPRHARPDPCKKMRHRP